MKRRFAIFWLLLGSSPLVAGAQVLGAMRLAIDEVKTESGLSEQARSSPQEIETLVAKSVQLASQISLTARG